jgi:hypothetical protein
LAAPLPERGVLRDFDVAELQRDIARLGFVISQIKEIEEARQERLEREPETGPHAMVPHLARVSTPAEALARGDHS